MTAYPRHLETVGETGDSSLQRKEMPSDVILSRTKRSFFGMPSASAIEMSLATLDVASKCVDR